jgi:hypothetical protein
MSASHSTSQRRSNGSTQDSDKRRGKEGGSLVRRDDLPAEVHERFLDSLLALEEAEAVSLAQRLAQAGLRLPAAEELDDAKLTDTLWEAVHALARLEIYLIHTDHLSDRELYEQLLEELEEPYFPVPDPLVGYGALDFTGSGSPREVEAYLRYYADAQFRRQWAEELPGSPMPERKDPPFDRDRHLPRFGWNRPRGGEPSPSPGGQGDVPSRVRRNAPCPCGSGRKAKRCCWGGAQPRGA